MSALSLMCSVCYLTKIDRPCDSTADDVVAAYTQLEKATEHMVVWGGGGSLLKVQSMIIPRQDVTWTTQ